MSLPRPFTLTPVTAAPRLSFELFVAWARQDPSPIRAHWGRLYQLGRLAGHITEFGTGKGRSTSALLWSGTARLISYDVVRMKEVGLLERFSLQEEVTDFSFVKENVSQSNIEPTEGLFIDTGHEQTGLAHLLERHADQVSRWIALHGGDHLYATALAFLAHHPQWHMVMHCEQEENFCVLDRER